MGGNQHQLVILVLIFQLVSLLSSVDAIRGSARINFNKAARVAALVPETKQEKQEQEHPLFYHQEESDSKPYGLNGSPPPHIPSPPPPPHKTPPYTRTPPPPPPPHTPATPSKSNYNPYYYVTQAGRYDLPPSPPIHTTVIEDTNDDLFNDHEEEDELFDTTEENSNYNPTTTKGKTSSNYADSHNFVNEAGAGATKTNYKTNKHGPASAYKTNPTQPQQGMSDNRYQANGMYFYDTHKEEFTSANHPTNLANQQYNRFTTNPTSTIDDVDSLDDEEDIEDFTSEQQP